MGIGGRDHLVKSPEVVDVEICTKEFLVLWI